MQSKFNEPKHDLRWRLPTLIIIAAIGVLIFSASRREEIALRAPSEEVLPDFSRVETRFGRGTVTTVDIFEVNNLVAAGGSRGVHVFQGSDPLWSADTGAPVVRVAFSPDGEYLAGALPEAVVVWNVSTGNALYGFEGLVGQVADVAWRPGYEQISVGLWSGVVLTYDTITGALLSRNLALNSITDVAWSPDGKMLAAATANEEDSAVVIWDGDSGGGLHDLRGHTWTVRSVDWSADGGLLASASDDATVRMWDAATGEEIAVYEDHDLLIWEAHFDSDGARLASVARDGRLIIRDVKTDAVENEYQAEAGVEPLGVAWLGDEVVMPLSDNTLSFWDGNNIVEEIPFSGRVESVDMRDGRIASGDNRGVVRVYNRNDLYEPLFTLGGHAASIEGLAFSPDGTRLTSVSGLSNGSDYALNVWRVNPVGNTNLLEGLHVVAWSVDGEQILSSNGTSLLIYDASTGELITEFGSHPGLVLGAAWSPEGDQVASVSQDGALRVWNIKSGQMLFEVEEVGQGGVSSVSWHSGVIATGTQGGIRLWRGSDGEHLHDLLTNRQTWAADVVFSPDGQYLVGGLDSGELIVWDTSTYEVTDTLTGHSVGVNSVVWTEYGLVSGSADGTVIVWEVD